ncbi:SH3 domain-containing protein [Staphylococcus pseudintermedius]|uniref:SH3 domain-containing protein n=2 Tax=Staphylococcus pseudintermedius TaxID=283734 RepID=UPI0023AE83DD|nr:SH3 domain-containing protein [Staphylococcus pseudintermedius]MDE9989247.1 SH3 domain-containing protein [Staphylococcus pseudintermedius]MDF0024079.1 SH3 domain-containing protein [Staphylococcus pseudintermedius]MDK3592000.1 SH3 domain-containing protein [Staphylococcus pseudintermedius]MDK3617871.1 SH3 domain-containing protein [Staphylococcus pseudintermedius]MDK3619961.1 SH3 domain-containing protein [Staphylococcus pseudintermedius]
MKRRFKIFKLNVKVSMTTFLILGGLTLTNAYYVEDTYFNNLLSKHKKNVAPFNLISVFNNQNAYAETTSKLNWSQKSATQYIQQHIGVGVDFDGYYGYQCMDLIVDYMYQLSNGNVHLNGNAYQAKNNNLGNYAKVYSKKSGFVPKTGDIVVWSPKSWNGHYGHIGIVKEATSKHFTTLEQNTKGNLSFGSVGVLVKHQYKDVAYFIRPHFSNKNRPSASSYSDTPLNSKAVVSDWMNTKSGIIYRHENGKYTVTRNNGLTVYSAPSINGTVVTNLKAATTLNYDYKYVNDGYIWVSFMKNHQRYYIQTGYSDGNKGYKIDSEPFGAFTKVNFAEPSYSDVLYNSNAITSKWQKTKSDITMRYENGRFKVTKEKGVAIYKQPNNNGKKFTTLKKHQHLIYDYKYIHDGYVWLGFEKNGKRYYAQVGYSDGKYGFKPKTQPFGKFE